MSFTISCRIAADCECGHENRRDVFLFGPNMVGAIKCSKCHTRIGGIRTFGPGDKPIVDATRPVKNFIWVMCTYDIRHT